MSHQDTYLVPRGDGKGDPIVVDLRGISLAESRIGEVATVTQHKAAELLSAYNESWFLLNKSVTIIAYERSRADDAVRRARAVALLSYTDADLKSRGHSKGSADLREALAELDQGVIAAKDRLNEIRMIHALLEGKMKAFENAHNAVKKLVATTQLPTEPLRGGNMPAPYSAPAPGRVIDDPLDAAADEPLPEGFGHYGRR